MKEVSHFLLFVKEVRISSDESFKVVTYFFFLIYTAVPPINKRTKTSQSFGFAIIIASSVLGSVRCVVKS